MLNHATIKYAAVYTTCSRAAYLIVPRLNWRPMTDLPDKLGLRYIRAHLIIKI